jgi:hypothetical protein
MEVVKSKDSASPFQNPVKERNPESQEGNLEDDQHSSAQPANGDAETSRCLPNLTPELIQRKYKCLILYAISIVSIIELVMLLFNSDQSSSKSIMDVLGRYVNRTQNVI